MPVSDALLPLQRCVLYVRRGCGCGCLCGRECGVWVFVCDHEASKWVRAASGASPPCDLVFLALKEDSYQTRDFVGLLETPTFDFSTHIQRCGVVLAVFLSFPCGARLSLSARCGAARVRYHATRLLSVQTGPVRPCLRPSHLRVSLPAPGRLGRAGRRRGGCLRRSRGGRPRRGRRRCSDDTRENGGGARRGRGRRCRGCRRRGWSRQDIQHFMPRGTCLVAFCMPA